MDSKDRKGVNTIDLRLSRKIINPHLDIYHVGIADRIGVTLKSGWIPRKPSNPFFLANARNARNRLYSAPPARAIRRQQSPRISSGKSAPPPEFIDEIALDASIGSGLLADDRNVRNSGYNFCSTSKFKQVPLNHHSPRLSASSHSPTRPVSICSNRYLPEKLFAYECSDNMERQSIRKHPDDRSKWNKGDQAMRFEANQRAHDLSKGLRRKTEIQSHRIDRLYYMSGNSLRVTGRYDIEDSEKKKLAILASAAGKKPITESPRNYPKMIPQTKDAHARTPVLPSTVSEERGATIFLTQGDQNEEYDEDQGWPTQREEPGTPKSESRPQSRAKSVASSHSGIEILQEGDLQKSEQNNSETPYNEDDNNDQKEDTVDNESPGTNENNDPGQEPEIIESNANDKDNEDLENNDKEESDSKNEESDVKDRENVTDGNNDNDVKNDIDVNNDNDLKDVTDVNNEETDNSEKINDDKQDADPDNADEKS